MITYLFIHVSSLVSILVLSTSLNPSQLSVYNRSKMEKFVSRTISILHDREVPRDGTRRYLYSIWQPSALLLLTIPFIAVFYAVYSPDTFEKPDVDFFCNADGKIEKKTNDYRPLWDSRLYFTINMAFGQMPFSKVKVIDAVWDVVVGRGGQVIAGMIAYRTLRRSLTLAMEQCALAISTVTLLYCQQVQVLPVTQLICNILWSWHDYNRWTRQRPYVFGRLRIAAQIFACVYVLLFATLVSVMTGYRVQMTGYLDNGAHSGTRLTSMSELKVPTLAFLDGSRINNYSMLVTSGPISYPDAEKGPYGSSLKVKDFIEIMRRVEEPFGTFFDCKYSHRHFSRA